MGIFGRRVLIKCAMFAPLVKGGGRRNKNLFCPALMLRPDQDTLANFQWSPLMADNSVFLRSYKSAFPLKMPTGLYVLPPKNSEVKFAAAENNTCKSMKCAQRRCIWKVPEEPAINESFDNDNTSKKYNNWATIHGSSRVRAYEDCTGTIFK